MIALREKIVRGDIGSLKTCGRCDRLWRKRILGIPREYLGRARSRKWNEDRALTVRGGRSYSEISTLSRKAAIFCRFAKSKRK